MFSSFLLLLASVAVAFGAGITRLGGVNLAGFDFGIDTNGQVSGDYVVPPVEQVQHFANEGANLFRVPLGWQRIQPTLGGALNSTVLSQYKTIISAVLNAGAYAIIDIHNYARVNGSIVGQGGPTNAQFADLWSRLASQWPSESKIIFGIMNEPHDLDLAEWAGSTQAAVDAIRAAGATSQYMLIPGDTYTSAGGFSEWYPTMKTVNDSGTSDKSLLLFDIHQYLDSDNSGTHSTCASNGTANLATVISLLGGRQAVLSETGGGESDSCYTYLPQEIQYVQDNYDNGLAGFAGWGAGAFDTTYILDLAPDPNDEVDGTDEKIWTVGFEPFLPS